jgi:hypothetical protein
MCPKDRNIDWHDINYFENSFSADVGQALFGEKPLSEAPILSSPDSTSDGNLKKRWIIAGEKRYLVKAGSIPFYQEPSNEVIASKLMDCLRIPHIDYTMSLQNGLPVSICEDFVNKDTELVTAWMILGQKEKTDNSISHYQHFINCCEKQQIPGMGVFLDKMLTVDYIVGNTDRHYNNFGMLRDANSLSWISPAPLFDTGTSLWCASIDRDIRPALPIESKPFRSNHSEQIKLVKNFDWVDFGALENFDEICDSILRENTFIVDQRRSAICFSLKARIQQVKDIALPAPRPPGIPRSYR